MTTGDVLWRPTPESLERMQLAGYLRWLGDEKGRVFERYRDLWEWSVGDLSGISFGHDLEVLEIGRAHV